MPTSDVSETITLSPGPPNPPAGVPSMTEAGTWRGQLHQAVPASPLTSASTQIEVGNGDGDGDWEYYRFGRERHGAPPAMSMLR